MKKMKSKSGYCDVQKCVMCKYFQSYSDGQNVPYSVDRNGVKHRAVHYTCLYDMHDISPGHICDRGYPLYDSVLGGNYVSATKK